MLRYSRGKKESRILINTMFKWTLRNSPCTTKELSIDWVLVSWWVCKQSQNVEKPGRGLIIIPQRNSFKKRLGFLDAAVLKACRTGKCEKKKNKLTQRFSWIFYAHVYMLMYRRPESSHYSYKSRKTVWVVQMFNFIVLVCVWVREMIYLEIEKIIAEELYGPAGNASHRYN